MSRHFWLMVATNERITHSRLQREASYRCNKMIILKLMSQDELQQMFLKLQWTAQFIFKPLLLSVQLIIITAAIKQLKHKEKNKSIQYYEF